MVTDYAPEIHNSVKKTLPEREREIAISKTGLKYWFREKHTFLH